MPKRSIFTQGKTLDEIGALAQFAQRIVDLVNEAGFESGEKKRRRKRKVKAGQETSELSAAQAAAMVKAVLPTPTRAPRKAKAKTRRAVPAKPRAAVSVAADEE